jgi:hypothetical protein
MADAPTAPAGAVTTPIDNYAEYYRDTDWAEHHVNPAYVIHKCAVSEDGMTKTGQQLYDNVRLTSNDMPHVYATLIKEESWLVLLHRAGCHAAPLGTTLKLWNNKVLMFTGDVMENQVPQGVFFPPLLLAPMQSIITVDRIERQLLKFRMDDNLQLLEPPAANVSEDKRDNRSTGHALYIPPQFVHLFLEHRLTSHQALVSVHCL